LYLYYRKVCQFLDTEEGESTVSGLITMDQLDMLLCTLPSEETFRWGRWGDKTPEDLPDMFYDFCWQRATATQEDDAATDKDALQSSAGTPSAEPRRTRARRSRTRGSCRASATTGTAIP
jgi:hypothetical protein